jgi:hypothetical protein
MLRINRRAAILALVPGFWACGSGSEVRTEALEVMEEVFGPCFAEAGIEDWRDVAVVRTTEEVDGVVPVEIRLTLISSGEKVLYQFRVNTGLGDFSGIPGPGTGIPQSPAANELVAGCDA